MTTGAAQLAGTAAPALIRTDTEGTDHDNNDYHGLAVEG